MINYYLLTKPGIILGNLATVAAGFILGSKGGIAIGLFLAVLFGLAFVIASACVFNNYIDRDVDKKMDRTKGRALVQGKISGQNALLFATLLAVIGTAILLAYTNFLTVAIVGAGFFVYVLLYSFWKCRSVYGTAIGSIAGAVPPVAGYCAASSQFDAAAVILFGMMVFWQMPHFFAIALFHLEDYAKGGVHVLPLSKGILTTKIHMFLYIAAFIPIAMLLTLFGYTGYLFLMVIAAIGLIWLAWSLKGFGSGDSELWGRQMFFLSLVVIMAVCVVIPIDMALKAL